jgi:hypothetical protein
MMGSDLVTSLVNLIAAVLALIAVASLFFKKAR